MKIIISPAKSLDFDSELNTKNFSNPKFLEKTLAINSILKKKSPKLHFLKWIKHHLVDVCISKCVNKVTNFKITNMSNHVRK